MNQFFKIVYGGILVIVLATGIVYGSGWLWNNAGSFRQSIKTVFDQNIKLPSMAAVADAIVKQPTEGTFVSGIKRTIRYTASEEENLLHAATESLQKSSDKNVTAKAYIVKNITVGGVVTEQNSSVVMPIASITKLVTAIVARKLIDPNERVTITEEIVTTYGNTAQFRKGEVFLAKDLYYPLLMVSSNDAAEALARDYGREKFIEAMNDFTQSIGAYATYFDDPSGLSPNNVSTSNDLVIILDWILKNDKGIIDITMLKSKTVKNHTWINPTHFLNWSTYSGGKNGYIPEAGLTAASLFTLGSRKNTYAIILLGSRNRDGDELKLLEKVK